jgi:signal transduction histidine kinase
MKWWSEIKLYFKLNVIIVGTLLLSSICISSIVIHTISDLFQRQMDKRGAEIGKSLAALSSNDVLLDDHYTLFDRVKKTITNSDDVRYILITDFSGRIVAHTFPTGLLPAGLPIRLLDLPSKYNTSADAETFTVRKYDSNEGPVREVITPIEGGVAGYVRVGMLEQGIRNVLFGSIAKFIIVTIFICLIASFVAMYLSNHIIRPLENLEKAARQISEGDYSIHIETYGPKEISHLAITFTKMMDSIKGAKVKNERLLGELRKKEIARTALIKQLIGVQEDERKRISRELHDETGQSLVSMLAFLKLLDSKLNNETQKELVSQVKNVAMDIYDIVKRMAIDLRPPILDELGLVAAMSKYINTYSVQQNCMISFYAPGEEMKVDDSVAVTLFRILQESLTNISKHAKANKIRISMVRKNLYILLKIEDDGLGANPDDLFQENHLGISGMRERVKLMGGSFEFKSVPGAGTSVTSRLPLKLENKNVKN